MLWQGSCKERAACCGMGIGRRGQHAVAWELKGKGRMLWNRNWKERAACSGMGIIRRGKHVVARAFRKSGQQVGS